MDSLQKGAATGIKKTEIQKSLKYEGVEPTRQLRIRVKILTEYADGEGANAEYPAETIWPILGHLQ